MSNTKLTHGSLFSGIGGFEIAASECGIETLWNCEIEPYCRLVLKNHFPKVTQYGDICKLDGGKVEPVDIISFGSPCQSFSVAGARKGLEGASGLFYEAVRVIKQMREATNGEYPKYAVMENVPGIYSSKTNNKSDFKEVLYELIKIKDKTVTIPECKGKKWLHAGVILGSGYSLSWRTLSADGFGVAQRRRRMFLVISFGDERAGEILFEQESERRDFTPSYRKRQDSAGTSETSSRSIAIESHPQASRLKICEDGIFPTITKRMATGSGHYVLEEKKQAYGISAHRSHAMLSKNPHAGIFETDTAKTIDTSGGYPASTQGGVVIAIQGNAIGRKVENGPSGIGFREGTAYALTATDKGAICYRNTVGTILARDYKGIEVNGLTSGKAIIDSNYAIRRLTPLECIRLQGFPDDYLSDIHIENPTDQDVDYWYEVFEENRIVLGKTTKPRSKNQVSKWLKDPYSDTNAYKALGNALAVPCAMFVMQGIIMKHKK